MTKQECEQKLAKVSETIAKQGRIVDARLLDMQAQLIKLLRSY